MVRRLIPLVLAALALSACGSYTRHDFIEQADAICASTLQQERVAAGATTDVSAYLARVVPEVRKETSALQRLRRPPGSARQRQALRLYLAAQQATAMLLATYAADTAAHATASATSTAMALQALPLASTARASGLRVCGSAGATLSARS